MCPLLIQWVQCLYKNQSEAVLAHLPRSYRVFKAIQLDFDDESLQKIQLNFLHGELSARSIPEVSKFYRLFASLPALQDYVSLDPLRSSTIDTLRKPTLPKLPRFFHAAISHCESHARIDVTVTQKALVSLLLGLIAADENNSDFLLPVQVSDAGCISVATALLPKTLGLREAYQYYYQHECNNEHEAQFVNIHDIADPDAFQLHEGPGSSTQTSSVSSSCWTLGELNLCIIQEQVDQIFAKVDYMATPFTSINATNKPFYECFTTKQQLEFWVGSKLARAGQLKPQYGLFNPNCFPPLVPSFAFTSLNSNGPSTLDTDKTLRSLHEVSEAPITALSQDETLQLVNRLRKLERLLLSLKQIVLPMNRAILLSVSPSAFLVLTSVDTISSQQQVENPCSPLNNSNTSDEHLKIAPLVTSELALIRADPCATFDLHAFAQSSVFEPTSADFVPQSWFSDEAEQRIPFCFAPRASDNHCHQFMLSGYCRKQSEGKCKAKHFQTKVLVSGLNDLPRKLFSVLTLYFSFI